MQFHFIRANFKTIGSLVQMWEQFSFAIIAAHSLNPNSSPIKNRKTGKSSLKFSLETIEGTTGQKRRPKQPPKKYPNAGQSRPAPPRPRFKPSLNSSQSKRCTRIWHDKQRENGAIPIWNFNERTFAENSGNQWSRFSWSLSVRSQEKHRRAASTFPPKTQLTCLNLSVVKFYCYFELFLGIINTWKNPRIWSPWIFV